MVRPDTDVIAQLAQQRRSLAVVTGERFERRAIARIKRLAGRDGMMRHRLVQLAAHTRRAVHDPRERLIERAAVKRQLFVAEEEGEVVEAEAGAVGGFLHERARRVIETKARVAVVGRGIRERAADCRRELRGPVET